jgi:hypothetical protein
MPVTRFFARNQGSDTITIDLSGNPLCWRTCIDFPTGAQFCIFCCTAFGPNGPDLTQLCVHQDTVLGARTVGV